MWSVMNTADEPCLVDVEEGISSDRIPDVLVARESNTKWVKMKRTNETAETATGLATLETQVVKPWAVP